MGTPLVFQATWVSTVVAAHWMALEARARWRSFCWIIFSSTSRPCFLNRPALSAKVSGAKPVQPDMPRAILVSCAWAAVDRAAVQASKAAVFTSDVRIRTSFLKKTAAAAWKPSLPVVDKFTCIYKTGRPWDPAEERETTSTGWVNAAPVWGKTHPEMHHLVV